MSKKNPDIFSYTWLRRNHTCIFACVCVCVCVFGCVCECLWGGGSALNTMCHLRFALVGFDVFYRLKKKILTHCWLTLLKKTLLKHSKQSILHKPTLVCIRNHNKTFDWCALAKEYCFDFEFRHLIVEVWNELMVE